MPATGTRTSGVRYTREILEQEYRSGALDRSRQMIGGCVESMIARSLGLPNGEEGDGTRRIERRVTVGGRTVAALAA